RHTRSYGDWSSDVCSSDLPREIQDEEFADRDIALSTLGPKDTQDAIPSAIALFRGKDYDGALAKAQAAVQADPNSWQAWEVMGRSEERRVGKGWRGGRVVR